MSISIPSAFKTEINIPYGELHPIVDWCDRNCKDEWRFMEDPHGDMYSSWVFFFENERDYVAFLMWKK
jgi:hypothetical protein